MRKTVPLDRLEHIQPADRGLTSGEAADRYSRFGANNIIERVAGGWRALALDTLKDPMLWFLLATAVLFALLGEFVEASILSVAIIPLIGMDLVLHRRTQASTESLAGRLASYATAVREERTLEIPSLEVVPGDLVLVSAGQSFPADGVLIRTQSLQVDESTLTGEAYPVRKQPIDMIDLQHSPSVDARHWGFAGTRVLTGQATLRVLYTAGETLYGEIVRSARLRTHERTPLQSTIANLVSVLLIAAAVMCVVLAWVRFRQGFGIIDALVSAMTLAVAALPEEFPVVFTFFLGVGVYRLAKKQALVRRAVVVENIGRVSCICTDKTGTVTEGRLHLAHDYPAGGINRERLLHLAAFASRAEASDPLDTAIFQAVDSGLRDMSRVHVFPFTEDRKRETAVVKESPGKLTIASKGAPETVLAMVNLSAADRSNWQTRVAELAGSGHKVIGCAWREVEESQWAGGEPDSGFNFAGVIAFEDPVRPGVADAVENCRYAGIHVLMITGDHPATAIAVAREIGLGSGSPKVVEPGQLAGLPLVEKGNCLRSTDGVARATPSQKLDLVQSLKEAGEIVAVTGDGVNDVPALQAADIGIAMGERGTSSAREVAAIVLLDDNFRTITRAIGEGRQLFENLKLSFAYLLMVHIPLVITAAVIPLAGFPLLYLPVHIVWLELIIHPTALLVFQELPASLRLTRWKRPRHARFFSPLEWSVIASVGVLVTLMVIVAYDRSLGAGFDVEHARAMALVLLTVASAMLTAVLSGLRTKTSWTMVGATIGLSFVLTQVPEPAALLHLKPLHWDDWLLALGGAALVAAIPAVFRIGARL